MRFEQTSANQAIDQAMLSDGLSLRHLQAALARLDVLIRREVRRWQTAGQDPNDDFRGLYVSDDQAEALIRRPFATSWGHTAALEPDELNLFTSALQQATLEMEWLADEAHRREESPRLEQLISTFELDAFERDTLLVCLAPALDLRYERLYGYLQDDITRKRPNVNLVLDLLGEPSSARLLQLRYFAADSPLFRHQILEFAPEPGVTKPALLSRVLCVDETVVSWLLGSYQPRPELRPYAELSHPRPDPADELLAGPDITQSLAVARDQSLFVFFGPDQTGQDAAARFFAARLGLPLLSVDLAPVSDADLSIRDVLQLALRDARLLGAAPYLKGWDACLVEGAPPTGMLAELCDYPGLDIVAGQSAWQAKGVDRQRPLLWIEFPLPNTFRRKAVWEHYLDLSPGPSPNIGAGSTFEIASHLPAKGKGTLDLDDLAGRFVLSIGQIRDAVAAARDQAAQRGELLEIADLFATAREHSSPRLSGLARKITPRYSWEDIVLPPDPLALLKELVATVRLRPQVLETWGVGKKLVASDGVTALFAGPPGTGKTMAAEVIAAELGLDLYKIDLSMVVSKYIGETEKNLEQIFAEAESSNAILFFDEADALFGKRSEVRDSHDRYANIEISYLLQRMETYDGVTILATNLRANLDEAFTRRLQFVVDFPFPGEADRLRIWQALFPLSVPRDSTLDFNFLSHHFKLPGGSIRNILVSAAYLAASDGCLVTMEHLLHGTRRELQKMGRLVQDFEAQPEG